MKPSMTGRNAAQWNAGKNDWVVTTDNSGGIGEKELDEVQAPYETVAYFSFRTAVLDALSAGALPKIVLLHNFCGNEAWEYLYKGISNGLQEIGLSGVEVSGSTESNFNMLQSAVSITVIGERFRYFEPSQDLEWTLEGEPLVGKEVLMFPEKIASLSRAAEIAKDPKTAVLWPVGSKGIAVEWESMHNQYGWQKTDLPFKPDPDKSAGPATCFIAGKRK
ncbi:ATP-binding protein [Jeotgalibacillus sp. ET6]|uniref:ATP-binding protein n=1 Tax=Jeotgalibacillus sp. ET6 TaxID=3037260 RepID=UPI00241865E7|nr:ATP-binding protein [Jeotgalibacillus sp. ET6]MDG5471143.1 ATP-binding protein [Jeotgalibacillus sp. ET6]